MGKGKKKKKSDKHNSNEKHANHSSELTSAQKYIELLSPGSDFERVWIAYGTSYMHWAKSFLDLQNTAMTTTFSWFEMCRKTLEFDTELLKSTSAYLEEHWQESCTDSVAQHLKAVISSTSLQADVIRDIQIKTLQESNRQWARFFGF